MTSLRKDDGSVAAVAVIAAGIEGLLTAARRKLEGITKERKAVAYKALGLDDADAISRLTALTRDETAARERVHNLDLAFEMARIELATAREAEISARKPVYNCDRTRRIGGLEIPAGQEFTLLTWPTENDAPLNDAAEQVTAYFEANEGHPQLPDAPWHAPTNTLYLPTLPPREPPRPQWRDPRRPWTSSNSALDSISISKPPDAPPPRRPAGARRRVTL